MKKLTGIVIAFIILLFVFLVYQFGKSFAPGSYPYAEIYKINSSENNVIEAINQFKNINSDFKVPNVTIKNSGSYDLKQSEGRKENSHWNLNYFYFKQEDKIILTWTRPASNDRTDFALVSVNEGLDIGNWKVINKDLNNSENRKIKEQFEEFILTPIKDILKIKSQ